MNGPICTPQALVTRLLLRHTSFNTTHTGELVCDEKNKKKTVWMYDYFCIKKKYLTNYLTNKMIRMPYLTCFKGNLQVPCTGSGRERVRFPDQDAGLYSYQTSRIIPDQVPWLQLYNPARFLDPISIRILKKKS